MKKEINLRKSSYIIYGAGYHARNIYRAFYKKKKIIYFFDIAKFGKKIFNKKILYPQKKIFNNKILFAGLSGKKVKLIIKKFNWQNKNVIVLTKKDIQLSKEKLLAREAKTLGLLKKITRYFNISNFNYFLNFSSLLAYIRKDHFSFYSDVDISLDENDFKIFKKQLLLKKIVNDKFVIIKRKKISLIIGKNDNISFEPPNIDISMFKIKGKKIILFRQNINKTSNIDFKYLQGFKKINYKGMKLSVPQNLNSYLTKIYGKNFKKKPLNWNKTNIKI
tara:strand:- start:454 stop:1284 length:831 start_codon:yes stop_codon:yes gene_type:complete